MAANVLPFKQPKVTGTQPKGPDPDRLWFCTTCKGDAFKLDLGGDVWCSWCKAYINNLKVTG